MKHWIDQSTENKGPAAKKKTYIHKAPDTPNHTQLFLTSSTIDELLTQQPTEQIEFVYSIHMVNMMQRNPPKKKEHAPYSLSIQSSISQFKLQSRHSFTNSPCTILHLIVPIPTAEYQRAAEYWAGTQSFLRLWQARAFAQSAAIQDENT